MAAADRFLLTYSDLLPLWQDWIITEPKPPMDRWLKQPQRFPKNSHHAYRIRVNNGLLEAVRFQQLADALEFTLSDPDFDNWGRWDESWSAAEGGMSTPQHFWYWVQLRSQSDWRTPDLPQQKSRREHFLDWQKAMQSCEELTPRFLLWHGIRPGWLPALRQRAKRSGWSEQELLNWVRLQSTRPPLWLRRADDAPLEEMEQELVNEGIDIRIQDGELTALGGRSIHQTAAYKAGRIEVQDIASQMLCQQLGVEPGYKVWDACAGAGGKTLTLASALKGKGAVVATDHHAFKLDELKRRAKRAGVANIRSFEWDGEAPLRLPAEIKRQQGFDRILVDAPCSNSGTWRRNPDARWRLSHQDTAELNEIQLKLLTHASAALRENGKLLYATCSWQAEENEQLVARFLEQNPGWKCERQAMVGAPIRDSDTMFYALLVKAD
ncbi:MAG: RsmB/NOP family class I SAM-dependent RNA methyltransferase [Oceanobacter sp.]